jgi:23S rRNA (adenine2030-N6)-methyltransferase
MNYRHAYHAGNHGDVLKHAILTRVLTYFTQKPTAFAVLDAHAGIGVYDLLGLEAFKTGEWKDGIAKTLSAELPSAAAALLEPYFATVRALNAGGELVHYPGSPEIARQLLRKQDRLLLNELHPQDHETLAARYAAYSNVRVECVDALQSVKAALPFLERRGVLLIDPPYEVTDESERVSRTVSQALRRMAHLCVLIWYPVTAQKFADQLCASLPLKDVKSALRIELLMRKPQENGGMAGSGLVVVNPPWVLFNECQFLLPELAKLLAAGQGKHRLEWLVQPA